jgi:hypothetical protein
MKHWDLCPNETVTLESRGERVRARFLFRDTAHACFEIDEGLSLKFCEFKLRRDGDLAVGFGQAEVVRMVNADDYNSADIVAVMKQRRRVWRIEGADRNTRYIIPAAPPLESRRAFAAGGGA